MKKMFVVIAVTAGAFWSLEADAQQQTLMTVYKPQPACQELQCSPKPNPYPLPDDCRHRPCEPKSIEAEQSLRVGSAVIGAAVADRDVAAAGAGLEALFSGAKAPKGMASSAVFAGDDASAGTSSARLMKCGDKDGCKSEFGKRIEDAVQPITDAIDKAGDRLRDRNDDKLHPKGGKDK